MGNLAELFKQIDQIVGCEGQMQQNLMSLPAGEHIIHDCMYYFGINVDYCMVYPEEVVTRQTAMLITLLVQEVYGRDIQENTLTQILKQLLKGNDVSITALESAGMQPGMALIPLVMEIKQIPSSWWDLFYSYFTDKVIGVTLEEYFYALIPTDAVAIDPTNLLELEELGQGFAGLLIEEGIDAVGIGFAEPVMDVDQWRAAFAKAKRALGSGTTFFPKRLVYFSWKMRLENLILTIPSDAAETYIREILGPRWITQFDSEIYKTVDKLIRENFNLSETARKLFIHRNTLLYRLERVKEETDKDLRNSGDALQVYLAMLLSKRYTN